MATTPTSITGSPRGISRTLANFVIESENITETPIQEDFDDQEGARADEQVYDTRTDLKLTVYGAVSTASVSSLFTSITGSGGKTITYDGVKYKVDSCEEAGTYNGRRRWNITAHKFTNFPAQS